MRKTLTVLVFCLLPPGVGFAQEAADLLGHWTFEIPEAPDSRCGASKTLGEMYVSKKITARAYRGISTVRSVTERCGQVSESDSGFTLRVRDGQVSIEYDDESWTSDSLVFSGNTMSGYDSAGTPMEYVRQSGQLQERTTADLAALDEFLEGLVPDLNRELRAEFGQKMLENLRRTGLSRDESTQVAAQTVARMTDCVIDLARAEILQKDLPIDDVISGRNTTVLLQPENIDYRQIECIYEAAQNAGIVIR